MADPSYNSVSLLLHCDGSNGSTTFTDNAPTPKTVTVGGNAQISTAQSKFGGASTYFDGAGDYIHASTSTDFNFGTGDFTLEFWVYPTNVGTTRILYCDGTVSLGGAGNLALYMHSSNQLQIVIGGSGQRGLPAGDPSFVNNTWYHIAISRQGTALRYFRDGTLLTTLTSSYNFSSSANRPVFGIDGDLSSFPFIGYMDDIRITKGVARYTANFTAPTEAFSNSLTDPIVPIIGTLSLTGLAATNATGFADSAIQRTVTLTGLTPPPSFNGSISRPIQGNITLSGQTPSSAVGTTGTAVQGSVSITGQTPSYAQGFADSSVQRQISVVGGVALHSMYAVRSTPDIGQITVSGLQPSYATGFAASANISNIVLSGRQPDFNKGILLVSGGAFSSSLTTVFGWDVSGGSFSSSLESSIQPFQDMAVTGGSFATSLDAHLGSHVAGGAFATALSSTITGIPALFITGGSFNTSLNSTISSASSTDISGGAFSSSLDAHFGMRVSGGGFNSSLSSVAIGYQPIRVTGGKFHSAVSTVIKQEAHFAITGGAFRSEARYMQVSSGKFRTDLRARIHHA